MQQYSEDPTTGPDVRSCLPEGRPFLILTKVSFGWRVALADSSCPPLLPGYFMDHSVAFRDLPIR